jgi:hypothetical protein
VRRVRGHADFGVDDLAQLSWLAERGEAAWIESLLEATLRLVRALETFPAMGSKQDARGPIQLRSVRYQRLPYVAWYVYDTDDPDGDLWLVRLFHAHQLRPRPDLSRWFRQR